MANLKQWLLEEANDEKIEAVVIGEMGWGSYRSEEVHNYTEMPKGQIISWQEAEKWLDYEFSSGYGAPGCNAVYAWTTNKVIAIYQYDGSTGVYWIPRNPTDIMPDMVGG
jgi:hypothetical protein